ncbi:hypothetical protein BC831DRAFT_533071 [Entophlyctis helioformis]|nr:hypothetical protein BC831DRAFT_533071 [Entophlyctis helioformis]
MDDLQSRIAKVKAKLEDWKARFELKYGCKPKESDIRNNEAVAKAYSKYKELKQRIKESALQQPALGAHPAQHHRTRPPPHAPTPILPTTTTNSTATDRQQHRSETSRPPVEFIRSPFASRISVLSSPAKQPLLYPMPPAHAAAALTSPSPRRSAVQRDDAIFKTPTSGRRAAASRNGTGGMEQSPFKSPLGIGAKVTVARTMHSLSAAESAETDTECEWIGPTPKKVGRFQLDLGSTADEREDERGGDDGKRDRDIGPLHQPFLARLKLAQKAASSLDESSKPVSSVAPSSANRKDAWTTVYEQTHKHSQHDPRLFRNHPRVLSMAANAAIASATSSQPTPVATTTATTTESPVPDDGVFGAVLNKPHTDRGRRVSDVYIDDTNDADPADTNAKELGASASPDDPKNDKYKIRNLVDKEGSGVLLQKRAVLKSLDGDSNVLCTASSINSHLPLSKQLPSFASWNRFAEPPAAAQSPIHGAVVRPHVNVMSRTLRRESSKTLILPTNYTDFLSEHEQRVFADVIRDIDERKKLECGSDATANVGTMSLDAVASAQEQPCDTADSMDTGMLNATTDAAIDAIAVQVGTVASGMPAKHTKPKRATPASRSTATRSRPQPAATAVSQAEVAPATESDVDDDVNDDDAPAVPKPTVARARATHRHIKAMSDSDQSDAYMSDSQEQSDQTQSSINSSNSSKGTHQEDKGDAATSGSPRLASSNFHAYKIKSKPGGGGTGSKSSKPASSSSRFGRRSTRGEQDTVSRGRNAFGELEQIESVPKGGDAILGVSDIASPSLDTAAEFVFADAAAASDTCVCVADPATGNAVFVDLEAAMKRLTGIEAFRPGQREAVERTVLGKSTMLVLPTGGGKSLCYQVPAYVFRYLPSGVSGIMLVVSPTISLMHDQMRCLPSGLRAACLSSAHQSATLARKIYASLEARQIDVLFVAPERLQSASFIELVRVGKIPPIRVACIDEAHCMSEWSHNFRTSYLHLPRILRNAMGVKCFLALTGTATTRTATSICDMLGIDAAEGLITGSVLRENLHMSVSRVVADENREAALVDLLRTPAYRDLDSIIVYTMFQAQADHLAQYLRVRDMDADSYHAGKPPEQRDYVQSRFLLGKLRIIVATVAFGLGINKANVRSVIHYAMPKSLEDYTQEMGRSGRDGGIALCHLFLSQADYVRQRSFVFSDGIDEGGVWRLLRAVFAGEVVGNANGKRKGSTSRAGKSGDAGDRTKRVVMPVDELEVELDAKETVIATLLSYIELSSASMPPIKTMPTLNATHTIYGSRPKLDALAETSDLVRAILTLGSSVRYGFEFDTLTVAQSIGMEPQDLVSQLWRLQSDKQLKFSGTNRAFHILVHQDWTTPNDRQAWLESMRDMLTAKMSTLETASVRKLDSFYATLYSVASDSLLDGVEEAQADGVSPTQRVLMDKIAEYFTIGDEGSGTASIDSKWGFRDPELVEKQRLAKMNVEISIKAFVKENIGHVMSGRAVARIFHGLSSPKFPARDWSKSKYWNMYPHFNFKDLSRLADKAILDYKAKHGARSQSAPSR